MSQVEEGTDVKVVEDSGWKSIHQTRELSVEYRGNNYNYRRWIRIPTFKYDDYEFGDEWGKDYKHIDADDVPQEVIQFVNDVFDGVE